MSVILLIMLTITSYKSKSFSKYDIEGAAIQNVPVLDIAQSQDTHVLSIWKQQFMDALMVP